MEWLRIFAAWVVCGVVFAPTPALPRCAGEGVGVVSQLLAPSPAQRGPLLRIPALAPFVHLAHQRAGVGARCDPWPQWERFKQLYVSPDGRVIDASSERQITTSEGQSYALFFALVANDSMTFARLLQWTENNLAQGNLQRTLPAWQWGRADDGTWRVLDANAASDSDLWIAYTLAQAGRLWRQSGYADTSRELSRRILREEVAAIPGLGAMLLPGPRGFVEGSRWRLNASYAPIQVLRGIAHESRDPLWDEVIGSSERVILESAPRGFASDWIEYHTGTGFMPDSETGALGSYNAIRVYLWAGMLPTSEPRLGKLVRRLQPMVEHTAAHPAPPEEVDVRTLAFRGEGSPGFSAALLPLLAIDQNPALQTHRARVEAQSLKTNQAYYSDVLTLFGLGWLDGRYRFEHTGALQVNWKRSCAPTP